VAGFSEHYGLFTTCCNCFRRQSGWAWLIDVVILKSHPDIDLEQRRGGLNTKCLMMADRAYDADWLRNLVFEEGDWANIPPKSNRTGPFGFSPLLCKLRSSVERFVNKLNHYR
jgi:transposase